MKLQKLFESTGDIWIIVLDLNDGHFADDDVFANMEVFGSEAGCIDRIFEHFEKAFSDEGEDDNLDELRKMRKRCKTVQNALDLIDNYSALDSLDGVIMVQKKMIKN